MKKLKTFEMIKLADENGRTYINTTKFETLYQKDVGFFNSNGNWYCQLTFYDLIHLDGWQLQRQYIPFMEAAKEFEKSNTIICELDGDEYEYSLFVNDPEDPDELYTMQDQNGSELSVNEILYGKWYVKEDEPQ